MLPVAHGTHWFPLLALCFITEARNPGIEFSKLLCQQGLICGLDAVRETHFYKKKTWRTVGGSKPFIPSNNGRGNTDVGRQEAQFYFTSGADGLRISMLVTCLGVTVWRYWRCVPVCWPLGRSQIFLTLWMAVAMNYKGDVLGVQNLCNSSPSIIHITLFPVLNSSYLKYWVISVSPILP